MIGFCVVVNEEVLGKFKLLAKCALYKPGSLVEKLLKVRLFDDLFGFILRKKLGLRDIRFFLCLALLAEFVSVPGGLDDPRLMVDGRASFHIRPHCASHSRFERIIFFAVLVFFVLSTLKPLCLL